MFVMLPWCVGVLINSSPAFHFAFYIFILITNTNLSFQRLVVRPTYNIPNNAHQSKGMDLN